MSFSRFQHHSMTLVLLVKSQLFVSMFSVLCSEFCVIMKRLSALHTRQYIDHLPVWLMLWNMLLLSLKEVWVRQLYGGQNAESYPSNSRLGNTSIVTRRRQIRQWLCNISRPCNVCSFGVDYFAVINCRTHTNTNTYTLLSSAAPCWFIESGIMGTSLWPRVIIKALW